MSGKGYALKGWLNCSAAWVQELLLKYASKQGIAKNGFT